MADTDSTPRGETTFDFDAYPEDTCFHDRRSPTPVQKPPRKERRRRIDPTTFEKQYTDDELEFMNAMQQYKLRSGKPFPSFGEVLRVAWGLGYRRTGIASDIPGMAPRTKNG